LGSGFWLPSSLSILSLALLKEQHLDRPFPDMPYAGVSPLSPCPEVWPFWGRGGEIPKTRLRRGKKNKKEQKESVFRCGGEAAATKNNLLFRAAEAAGGPIRRGCGQKAKVEGRGGGAKTPAYGLSGNGLSRCCSFSKTRLNKLIRKRTRINADGCGFLHTCLCFLLLACQRDFR